jgi:hypothetical protein
MKKDFFYFVVVVWRGFWGNKEINFLRDRMNKGSFFALKRWFKIGRLSSAKLKFSPKK